MAISALSPTIIYPTFCLLFNCNHHFRVLFTSLIFLSCCFHSVALSFVSRILATNSPHGQYRFVIMHRRRQFNVSNHKVTSGSSCTSSADTDDARPLDSSSETDFTELECSFPAVQKGTQRKSGPSTEIHQPSQANTSNVELIHQARYQDPADDTDEDLSKVPEDYGRSKNTKKLNLRLKERWARYVTRLCSKLIKL